MSGRAGETKTAFLGAESEVRGIRTRPTSVACLVSTRLIADCSRTHVNKAFQANDSSTLP